MDYSKIATRIASQNKVKVWVDEATGLFKVEYNGQVHSANMPEDPDEGEPQNVNGDIGILTAATHAWNGEPYFEMTPEEFAKNSGGYWSPEN